MMNTEKSKNSEAKCLINGIAADYISIHNRGLHYGDGLFETILCFAQKIYYWELHYQRLKTSADKLAINCPSAQQLLQDIKNILIDVSQPCVIKIILTRGNSQRGYQYDKSASSSRIVMRSAINTAYSSLLSKKLLSGHLFLCEQQVSINQSLAGLKHLNRLENVLARNEWQDTVAKSDRHYIDGVMLNHYSHVIEGSMSNLFAVKNNVLMTPDLSLSGVNGIMRQLILDLADNIGIPAVVENMTLDQFMNAEELFISNSLSGMKSVCCFNNKTFDHTGVTQKLFNEVLDSIENNAEKIA